MEKKEEEHEYKGFIRGPSQEIGKTCPTSTRGYGTRRNKGIKENHTPKKATRVSLPIRSVANIIPKNAKLAPWSATSAVKRGILRRIALVNQTLRISKAQLEPRYQKLMQCMLR